MNTSSPPPITWLPRLGWRTVTPNRSLKLTRYGMRCLPAPGHACSALRPMMRNPSAERTVNGLRLSPAAHVKREPAAKHIMSRSIVAIYAAAVCFASVGCMAIALGVFAHSTVSLVAPSLTMPPVSAARYEPQPHFAPPSGAEPPRLVPAAPLSEAELLKRRAAAHEVAIQDEVAGAGRSMLRWGIVSIVAGILFFAHWRILRKEPAPQNVRP